MRIAFLIAGLHEGGAERVVTSLANQMRTLGHDVRILVTWSETCVYDLHPGIPIVPLFQEFPAFDFGNKVYLYRKALMKRLFSFRRPKEEADAKLQTWKAYVINHEKAKVLAGYLNRQKIDILYSFMEDSNIIAGLCKPHTRTQIVAAERNFPLDSPMASPTAALRDHCYEKADRVVFQTGEQMACYSAKVQKKGTVIFNPIKPELPKPYQGPRKPVIVNYCRFAEQKNLPLLIRAFGRIAREYPQYRLELYGKGPLQEALDAQIRALGLSDRAAIYPFCPDIHSKISDYAMFALTSDFEGMPNALLEAMAIGMPVVSTDCRGGGAKAVIDNGVNGLLVPRNDEEALYCAMKRYIDDPDFAEICGQNAAQINNNLSVEQITQEWLRLYRG